MPKQNDDDWNDLQNDPAFDVDSLRLSGSDGPGDGGPRSAMECSAAKDDDPVETGELEFVDGSEKGDVVPAGAVSPPLDVSEQPLPAAGKEGLPKPAQPAQRSQPSANPAGTASRANYGSMEKIEFTLPNGSEGKTYREEIKLRFPKGWPETTTLHDINFQLHGLQECGIEVDRGDRAIELNGKPNKNGDIKIRCTYTTPANDGGRPALEQSLELTWVVNPDPRSLWKNIDPDPDQPYQKPHTRTDRVAGPCVLLAASVRGRSHAHEGTFRDDEFCVTYDSPSGWYLLAVSDGAGSAKYSRRGSEIACDTVRDEVLAHFLNSLSSSEFEGLLKKYQAQRDQHEHALIRRTLYSAMGGPALKAFKAIQEEAKKIEGAEVKHFAATLIFTIVKKFEFGWFVGAFCIGDGGAAIYSKEGEVRVLNQPDGGEFAGQTRFITMPEIWASGQEVLDRINFAVVDDLTAVIAMSDGVSDPKFQTDKNFFDTQEWHKLWQDLEHEVRLNKTNESADSELLSWLDFWSTGNHDDRTIALLLP